jgi:hypothetical protein
MLRRTWDRKGFRLNICRATTNVADIETCGHIYDVRIFGVCQILKNSFIVSHFISSYISVYLSTCLSTYLSSYISVRLSVCLHNHLYFIFPSLHPSVSLNLLLLIIVYMGDILLPHTLIHVVLSCPFFFNKLFFSLLCICFSISLFP